VFYSALFFSPKVKFLPQKTLTWKIEFIKAKLVYFERYLNVQNNERKT